MVIHRAGPRAPHQRALQEAKFSRVWAAVALLAVGSSAQAMVVPPPIIHPIIPVMHVPPPIITSPSHAAGHDAATVTRTAVLTAGPRPAEARAAMASSDDPQRPNQKWVWAVVAWGLASGVGMMVGVPLALYRLNKKLEKAMEGRVGPDWSEKRRQWDPQTGLPLPNDVPPMPSVRRPRW